MVTIAVLDVGHGDCSVIYNDDKSSVLVIDCNHALTLNKFLDEHEITQVNLALITHNDEDHVRGIKDLLQSRQVKCLALHSTIKDARGAPKRILVDLIDVIKQQPDLKVASLTTTDSRLDAALQGLSFNTTLLYPDPGALLFAASSNSTSGIVRVEHGGTVSLFGGDLDSSGWDQILSQNGTSELLKAHIFRFPHHGGSLIHARDRMDNQTVKAREYASKLMNIVQPSVTLISTAAHSIWEHPNYDVIDAVREYGLLSNHRMLCTEVTRLCDGEFYNKRDKVLNLLPVRHQSERIRLGSGNPCAGSIIVRVGDNGTFTIEPSVLDHRNIVALYPLHMCIRTPL